MSDGQLVLAYHGCDVSTRDRLVRGTLPHLAPSANRYDWLGGGVYFFEGDAERALSFAKSASMQPARHLSARPVVSPSVVGAVLCVSLVGHDHSGRTSELSQCTGGPAGGAGHAESAHAHERSGRLG